VVDVRLLASGAQSIELGSADDEGVVFDRGRLDVGGLGGGALLVSHVR